MIIFLPITTITMTTSSWVSTDITDPSTVLLVPAHERLRNTERERGREGGRERERGRERGREGGRERERERERGREREREGEREGGREGGRERGREGERERGREGERERERGRERERERGRERERERGREREREGERGREGESNSMLETTDTTFRAHSPGHLVLPMRVPAMAAIESPTPRASTPLYRASLPTVSETSTQAELPDR